MLSAGTRDRAVASVATCTPEAWRNRVRGYGRHDKEAMRANKGHIVLATPPGGLTSSTRHTLSSRRNTSSLGTYSARKLAASASAARSPISQPIR